MPGDPVPAEVIPGIPITLRAPSVTRRYGDEVTPRSITLAALANAAVPGVAPVSVTPVSSPHRRGADRFHTAVVTDSAGARWVVRLPADPVAAARQDAALSLLRLLSPRVPFKVPRPVGRMAVRDGRSAVVYPYLDGSPLDVGRLPARSQLTARVGRAVAAIHNLDRRLVDEAALPAYEAEDCRRRHVAQLDRAAQTRRMPTGLLSRWERMLEDVSLWRFAPTVVHGRLDGTRLLIKGEDPDDSETAEIVAVTGWDEAGVADPAADFTDLVRRCSAETIDTVFEAYAMARHEPADPKLLERAALLAELDLVAAFLTATVADDEGWMTRLGGELAELDARVGNGDASTRADDAPPFQTVPLDFSPPPVVGGLYQSGAEPPATATSAAVEARPSPPTPAVELDDREHRQDPEASDQGPEPAPDAEPSQEAQTPSPSGVGGTTAPEPDAGSANLDLGRKSGPSDGR